MTFEEAKGFLIIIKNISLTKPYIIIGKIGAAISIVVLSGVSANIINNNHSSANFAMRTDVMTGDLLTNASINFLSLDFFVFVLDIFEYSSSIDTPSCFARGSIRSDEG